MTGTAGEPIHLDTSFLIRALHPTTSEAAKLLGWLRDRRVIAVSALAWGEFLCGPLNAAEVSIARRIVPTHVPLDTPEATEAARLFNQSGRRRHSFADCVIAATALLAGATLATTNRSDFEPFAHLGLRLAE